jgi:hypothetical protein
MNQILHIFRKDVRHHWLEISAALAALALYAWHEPTLWAPQQGYSNGFQSFIWNILPALVPVAWCFLIVRVVQEETLVGDRQFWVTRPYEWQKLLAAKFLFVLAFVNFPLFIADLILLQRAGFPPVPYLAGLLYMQLMVILILFLPTAAAATVTPSVGQFLLVVLGVVLCLIAAGFLASEVPNMAMSPDGPFPGALLAFLFFGTCLFVIVWQYARRKTWQSRVALCGMVVALAVVFVGTPYRTLIARAYPLPENGQPPLAQFTFDAAAPHSHSDIDKDEAYPVQQDVVVIQLPLRVSGVAGDLIAVRGISVTIESPDGFRSNSHWQPERSFLRTNQDRWVANVALDKKLFERVKSVSVNLRVSLALTAYRLDAERAVVATANEFVVPGVGKCSIVQRGYWPYLNCRAPLKTPAFLATVDAATTTCPSEPNKPSPTGSEISAEGDWDNDPQPAEFGISPVAAFTLTFFPSDMTRQAPDSWRVCPGTPVTFRTPHPHQNSRFELEIDGIRVDDYRPRPVIPLR